MARHLSAVVLLAVAAFLTFSYLMSPFSSTPRTPMGVPVGGSSAGLTTDFGAIPENVLHGGSIAPKLENATAKYVHS